MIPRTAVALFTLSALVLAACGSDDDTPDADDTLPPVGAAPVAADLDGLTFESTEVTGHELVADSTITLAFAGDALSANAGCNTMNGNYSITDGTLEVGAMAATMMACPDDLMDQDTWLSEFLTSGPSIGLDGTTLTLTGDDATIALAEIEDVELVGTTWVVTGTVTSDAITSYALDTEPTITFTEGGMVEVDTGCNTGSGTVEIGDSTLTFGPIATTLRACEGNVAEVEAAMLATLQGEVDYTVDGRSLSLRTDGPDGEIGLELSAG